MYSYLIPIIILVVFFTPIPTAIAIWIASLVGSHSCNCHCHNCENKEEDEE